MSEFLLNCWYLAAWGHEIEDKPVRRRLLDRPCVLFRDEQGKAAVLLDRCPHRFAPLSEGRVMADGTIECPYHGLRFDGAGKCTHNPFTNAPHPQANMRAFPVAERENFIWFWPGDPKLAEQTPLPDYNYMKQTPNHRFVFMMENQQSNFQLGFDNLMDLSHAGFLHRPSFGEGTESFGNLFRNARHSVRQEGDNVIFRWEYLDAAGEMMPGMWVETCWEPPGRMVISKGHSNELPLRTDGIWNNLHILTPESHDSAHYFTMEPYESAERDMEHEERIINFFAKKVFKTEDDFMMKKIWADMQEMGDKDLFELNPVLLASDAGAVRARRVYKKLLEAQNAALATAAE